jgi:hypothetical protein
MNAKTQTMLEAAKALGANVIKVVIPNSELGGHLKAHIEREEAKAKNEIGIALHIALEPFLSHFVANTLEEEQAYHEMLLDLVYIVRGYMTTFTRKE